MDKAANQERPLAPSTLELVRSLPTTGSLCGYLSLFYAGGLVDADTARSMARHEQEAASHHQVFVEIDHVGRISDWQMDGEAGHQAPNGECESNPPRLKTN